MNKPKAPLAKLSPPRLPKIVERERLYKLLDQARARPIIWITAPPGMGKTTLAASYLKARKLKALWYQIDEGDADEATFFHYLGMAGQQYSPRFKKPLPHLTPEYLPGLSIFTRRFFEQLYQRIKTPAVMVFDNYHVLNQTDSIHELIKIGLEVIPNDLYVLVLSRLPPPPIFTRFLASQMMNVIKEGTLRLTPQETEALMVLKGRTPKNFPSTNEIRQLHDLTQGWLAGVILSLEHPTALSADLGNAQVPSESVFDFLAEEVMTTLPGETQDVLLRLAYIPSFTMTMAEALAQNPKAPSIVQSLYRRRCFIEQRGDSPPTYQFHPLFQLFLQNFAQTILPPKNLLQLQRHTAKLMGQYEYIEEAITIFLETKDFGEAATLLLLQAPSMLTQGRRQQVEEWIQHFPDDFLYQNPWLLFWHGQSQRLHNLPEAEQWFTKAFYEFEHAQDQDGQLAAWCALVETIHLAWSDWNRLDPWMEKLPHLIQTIPDFPASPLHAQVSFNMFSLQAQYYSNSSSFLQWKQIADTMLKTYPTLLAQLPAGFWMPLIPILQGKTQQATTLLAHMKTGISQKTLTPLAQLSLWYAEAHVAWQAGNLNQAEQCIDQAISYGRKTGCLVQELPFIFLRIWVKWSDYSFSDSLNILSRLDQQITQMPSHFADHCNLLNAAILFLTGDLHNANKHFSIFMESKTRCFILTDGYSHGWAAQIAYAQGDFDLANTYLNRVLILARAKDNLHFLIFGLGTRALWALNQKDEGTARSCLAEAFPPLRTQGLQFLHYWPKPQLSLLCAKALEWNIEVEFVQTLVKKFQLVPEESQSANPNWPWTVTISILGQFKLEIEGKPLVFGRKTPLRLLKFLKALIALGGLNVPEPTLTDLLWPDAEGDLAHQTFATTLHRLRKLLGHEEAILLRDGKVSLNPQLCWTDVWAFEESLDQIKNEKRKPDKTQILEQCDKVLALYQGCFLPGDPDEPWTFQTRERLQGRFIRELCQSCEHLSKLGQSEQAVPLLTQSIEREPLAEPLYRTLADTLRALNRESQAQAVEHQFQKTARHSLGIEVITPTLRLVANRSRKS